MTFMSAALAGLFALRDGVFQFLPWLALTIGLIFAHATNNLFNDYTDFKKVWIRTITSAHCMVHNLLRTV